MSPVLLHATFLKVLRGDCTVSMQCDCAAVPSFQFKSFLQENSPSSLPHLTADKAIAESSTFNDSAETGLTGDC